MEKHYLKPQKSSTYSIFVAKFDFLIKNEYPF